MSGSRSRQVALVAMMGALGNVLGMITVFPIAQQVSPDLSSLPVLIAAAFGGPVVGLLSGLIAGVVPSIAFGYAPGSLGLLGFTASLGKGVTGLVVGALVSKFSVLQRSARLLFAIILIGTIPELLIIYSLFAVLVPIFVPRAAGFLANPGFYSIVLVKAFVETGIMGVLVSLLKDHPYFRASLSRLIPGLASAPTRKLTHD